MKSLVILPVILWLSLSSVYAQVTNLSADGNLAVTNEFGCIPLSEVKSSYTPPDFTRAITICAESQEYPRAADFLGLAIMYGMQDRDRVSDDTARQGLDVLFQNLMVQLSPEQRAGLIYAFDNVLKVNSPAHVSFCDVVTQLGKPNYYPMYMVQHGIKAFTNRSDRPLIQDFPAERNWADILVQNGCL